MDRDKFTKEVFLGDNSTIPPVDPPDDGGGNEPTPEKQKKDYY